MEDQTFSVRTDGCSNPLASNIPAGLYVEAAVTDEVARRLQRIFYRQSGTFA